MKGGDRYEPRKTFLLADLQEIVRDIRGVSIVAWLHCSHRGCGKQSGSCHFQSGPNESPVRSNTIPDFRDITVDLSPSTCGRCIVPILALG